MNLNKFESLLKFFIPFAIGISALSFLLYFAVQQGLRLSANDPQIQMSTDAANYLANGGTLTFSPGSKVEMTKSLSPFLMLYDKNKKLISYTGVLNNGVVNVPIGALDAAKKNGENRITWEPTEGVRNAIVIAYYKGVKEGYVLVGRSLKEIEKREDTILHGIFVGWLITLFLTFASLWFVNLFLKSKSRK